MLKVKSLIERLMSGELTFGERKVLNQKLKENSNWSKEIKSELVEFFEEESNKSDEAFLLFENAISQTDNYKAKSNKKTKLMRSISGVAAAIAVVLISIVLFDDFSLKEQSNVLASEDQVFITTSDGSIVNVSNEDVNGNIKKYLTDFFDNKFEDSSLSTIHVPRGKSFLLELEDGTKIHLNSDTKMIFPLSFSNKKERRVTLEGEAYFEVSKNEVKPFLVETKELITKVYGTEFNISAYNDEKTNEIVLVEGSIGVKNGEYDEERVLKPSQMYLWEKDKERFSVLKVDTNAKLSWREGSVLFNDSSLSELKGQIERFFDITIIFLDESLKDKSFSGKIKVRTTEELLAIFNATGTMKCEYYANDRKLIIK